MRNPDLSEALLVWLGVITTVIEKRFAFYRPLMGWTGCCLKAGRFVGQD
jgi:hypothetical protein